MSRMFQIAYLITSTLIGLKERSFPRKKAMTLGFIAIISATIGFGLLSDLQSE